LLCLSDEEVEELGIALESSSKDHSSEYWER
jgi:hypothetical protein